MLDATQMLNPTTLAAALSGYGVDFMTGFNWKKQNARAVTDRMLTQGLFVSFTKPVFTAATSKITV